MKILPFRNCSYIWGDIVIKTNPQNPQGGNKGQMKRIDKYFDSTSSLTLTSSLSPRTLFCFQDASRIHPLLSVSAITSQVHPRPHLSFCWATAVDTNQPLLLLLFSHPLSTQQSKWSFKNLSQIISFPHLKSSNDIPLLLNKTQALS